jgi:excisionase family DNA binding protein
MGTGIDPHEELFTLKEISARLNVPYQRLRWHVYWGKLQAIYLAGRRLRVTASQLEAYLQARDEPLYTVPEVGARLQLSDQAVRALIYAGQLPAIYVTGHRLRVPKRQLEAYLQRRQEGSDEDRHCQG